MSYIPPIVDKPFSGNLPSLNSTVVASLSGANTAIFEITGTWVGAITFQGSNNGFATSQAITSVYLGGLASQSATTTINGFFSVLPQGFTQVQAVMSSYTSGTAVITGNITVGERVVVPLQGNPNNLQTLATQGAAGTSAWKVDGSSVTQPVSLVTAPLPTGASTSANQTTEITALNQLHTDLIASTPSGTNIIGKVGIDQTTPGTTNKVSIGTDGTVAINSALPAGTNTVGNVNIIGGNSIAVKVDGSLITQPISAATLPLPTGSATSALQTTLNSQIPTTLGQKTMANSMAIVIASDQTAIPISGSITTTNAANGIVGTAIPSIATMVAGTDGTNLRALKVSTTGVISVDGSAVTQPVSISTTVPIAQKASISTSITFQSSAVATGNGTLFAIDGMSATILTVSGVFVGTLVFEGTEDGTNFSALSAIQLGTSNISTSTTTTGLFEITIAGLVSIRARISAYTSGSITVTGHSVPVSYAPKIVSANIVGGNTTAVKVDGSAVTQPVSISGTIPTSSANNVPDVSGNGTINTQNLNPNSGVATAGSVLTLAINGQATTVFQVNSNTLGVALTFQGTLDGTNWTTIFGSENIGGGSQSGTIPSNATGQWEISCAGFSNVRVSCNSATAGSAVLFARASIAAGQIIGADIESIGGVPISLGQKVSATSFPIVIASDQSSIPVSISTTVITSDLSDGPVTPGTASTKSMMQGVQFNTVLPTLTTSQQVALQSDSSGRVLTNSFQLPTALGQNAAASSLAVTLSNENTQDLLITGQSAQTAIINNIIPVTASATATTVNGYHSASIQVVSSATGGTFIFENSNDNITWISLPCIVGTNSNVIMINGAVTASVGSNNIYLFPISTTYIRLRIVTTITGGSIQAFSRFSQTAFTTVAQLVGQNNGANLNVNVGSVTSGTASTNLGKARNSTIGATDTGIEMLSLRNDTLTVFGTSGNYNTPIADKYGSLIVKEQYLQKTTYSTAFTVIPAAAATDIFQITGSATKTVMIQKMTISGTQTTGGQTTIIISKRSTANTGGTSTASTLVPHDSADAASTTVGSIYTVNPTTGTAVGSIRIISLPLGSVTTTTNNIVEFNFGERGKPIVLNGVAQCIAINLNGVTLAGGSINIWMEYTEE